MSKKKPISGELFKTKKKKKKENIVVLSFRISFLSLYTNIALISNYSKCYIFSVTLNKLFCLQWKKWIDLFKMNKVIYNYLCIFYPFLNIPSFPHLFQLLSYLRIIPDLCKFLISIFSLNTHFVKSINFKLLANILPICKRELF